MNIPDHIRQRFNETENVTPVDRRKVRNSCISGHTPQDVLKCSYCCQARFNTLVSGYYNDAPTIGQVEAYLGRKEFDDHHTRENHAFVLEYLGLSEKER
ncbi:hypothetical protein [Ralstonia phage RP12]|uniref:Uncharacterized protein n=1 Tax=Ralstonia phage RP12 TaxID=1923889 RepID=A0A1L7N0L8_9CAUD|nr:hypothetical protein FDH28_gp033 [Ralstonia phage RP12]BAW19007.1 hypothetical protein [Ralstonia phage RP12]